VKTARRIRRFVDRELLSDLPASFDPLAAGLLDSLAIEQLTTFVEDRFDVVFDDEELSAENFCSIETLAFLVDAKRQRASRV